MPGGPKGKRVNTWNALSALRNGALRDAKRLSKLCIGSKLNEGGCSLDRGHRYGKNAQRLPLRRIYQPPSSNNDNTEIRSETFDGIFNKYP